MIKHTFSNLKLVAALISAVLLAPVTNASSYTVSISPKSESCFDFRTPVDRSTVVSGSFDLLDDDVEEGVLDVSIISHDTGDTLYRAPKDAIEGMFELKNLQASTRLQICFQNLYGFEQGEDNNLDLGFSIRVSNPPRALEDGVIGPDAERALQLVEKAAEIHKDWEMMRDHQEFTRNREAIHTEMSETILHRLSRWAFMEAFLVIGMALAQVMYWKRFFETRRYL